MSTEAPRDQPLSDGPQPRSESERLRDCSHWVSLLADQLEAMEQGDFPRVRELEAMRERLAEEMRDGTGGEAPLPEWVAERVEETLQRVKSWTEQERRRREEVALLQDGSLPLVRGIRRVGGGNYLSLEPSSAQFDVRL